MAGIGFGVVFAIGGSTVLGVMLDRKLATKPIFSLVFLFAGLAIGAWYAYKSLMEMIK